MSSCCCTLEIVSGLGLHLGLLTRSFLFLGGGLGSSSELESDTGGNTLFAFCVDFGFALAGVSALSLQGVTWSSSACALNRRDFFFRSE